MSYTKTVLNIPEKVVTDHLAAFIKKEIDAEVLSVLYRTSGWIEVNLTMKHSNLWLDEKINECVINPWIEQHCVGKYKWPGAGLVWFFELESDANWFKLRWQ